MSATLSESQYEVLSPWAEADPIAFRGISPRIESLNGKKIGLFSNYKRAAQPSLEAVEGQLKDRFPTARFDWYFVNEMNVPEVETENKSKFEEWLNRVDAVVTAFGD